MISDHKGVELSWEETKFDPEKSKNSFLGPWLELSLDLNYSIAKKVGTINKLYLFSDLGFRFTVLTRMINEELDLFVSLQQFKKPTNEKFQQVQNFKSLG